MADRDLLTEDEVIEAVKNFLAEKGNTSQKRLLNIANAKTKEKGIDLLFKLENDKKRGNRYIIEAKGNLRSNRELMKSTYLTNFKWAISQIILRIKVNSTKNNYIYGIAMPRSDIIKCVKLISDNWALKSLKIRLYGAYFDGEKLTAEEYLPHKIYK